MSKMIEELILKCVDTRTTERMLELDNKIKELKKEREAIDIRIKARHARWKSKIDSMLDALHLR